MTLTDKKELVARFLARCNDYADAKLAEYRARLEAGGDVDAAELDAKIGRWTAYRDFNAYAIDELASDRLDDWFDDEDAD